MSEHDGTDEEHRGAPADPPPAASPPYPGRPYPSAPSPRPDAWRPDPYATQPYSPEPYPSQPYPSQAYPSQAYPPPEPPDRTARPPAVGRLVQVMHAGAVAALLQGLYAALVVDDLLETSAADLEQVALDSGIDPARFADVAGQAFLVFLGVSTLLTVGLWLLFGRLFDRGRGQVAGTVLGVVNLLGPAVGPARPRRPGRVGADGRVGRPGRGGARPAAAPGHDRVVPGRRGVATGRLGLSPAPGPAPVRPSRQASHRPDRATWAASSAKPCSRSRRRRTVPSSWTGASMTAPQPSHCRCRCSPVRSVRWYAVAPCPRCTCWTRPASVSASSAR